MIAGYRLHVRLLWKEWTSALSLFEVMIPLSLYVTLEMAKLMQVYHIHNDVDMYDPETNKQIECRALNISEELVQVRVSTVTRLSRPGKFNLSTNGITKGHHMQVLLVFVSLRFLQH
jgi:hypothetical protein